MKKIISILVAMIGIVLTVNAQIPTNGLVANYSFDGTLNDAVSTYNLTSAGSTFETGVVSEAFKFTGSEECSNSDVNLRRVFDSKNSWSVNLWFNSNVAYDLYTFGGDASKLLFSCDGINSPPYKRTWISADDRGIRLFKTLVSGNDACVQAAYNFIPNTWYHVSVNFNGTTSSIYINGNLITDITLLAGDIGMDMGNDDANTTQITIGGNRQDNLVQWNGLIDQVNLYNRDLSASEVQALYNEGNSIDLNSGLVAFYPFNGNANDQSGNGNDLTNIGNVPFVTDRFGNLASAVSFDGVTQYLSKLNPILPIGNSSRTLSLWFYQNKYPFMANPWLLGYGDFSLGGNCYSQFVTTTYGYEDLSGGFIFSGRCNDITVRNSYPLNNWNNLILTWENTTLTFYLNGNLFDTQTLHELNTSVLNQLLIGGGGADSAYFEGYLDDINMYNRVLNASEITSLYQAGGWSSLHQGLVAYYPFNGNANDESGNNLNGTVTDVTLTSDRFNIDNRAYTFSSVGQHIDFFSSGSWCSGSHTISFWFNSAFILGKDQFIITKRSNCMGGSEAPWFEAQIHNNSNTLHVGWAGGGFGSTFSFSFIPDIWNNVIYVIDGTNSSLYLNGALLSSQVYIPTTNDLMLRVGNHSCPVPNDDYIGKFDDLGLWNRALNELEIDALFNEGSNEELTDIDGNVYNTVTIDTQTWMKENLKTTKYNDGTDIPLITDGSAWAALTTPGYCWYNNDEASNKTIYGALYNWYTVNTGKLCPTGWHVPSDGEWKTLEMYLGLTQAEADLSGWRGSNQGSQIKNTSGWNSNGNGTNTSGFSALPGGFRLLAFKLIGINGNFWSSTEYNALNSWFRTPYNDRDDLFRENNENRNGLSVRCLMDSGMGILLPTLTTKVGETFEVAVNTSELTSTDNITAYQFDYNYDINKLEYIGSSIAGTLAEGGSLEVNPTAGKLSVAWANATAIIGTGAILKLQFKSLFAGETTPTITNALYNTTSVTAINGVITSINKYGDIDDNEKVQAYDASLAIQYSVGLDPISEIDALPWENWRIITANVDGEGSITANDASEILKYTVGLITQFPVETSKKSASASIADVTIGIVNNEIVFYSSGDLFGLNINTTNPNQILGIPSILVDNFMSAFNINGTTYNLGLCTAYSPENGAAFMKIPYNKNGSVTFNMIINTEEKTVTVDLVTGMVEFSNDNISIYPNPVKDILKINGLTSATVASIYNTNGKLLISSNLNYASAEINVSDLPVGIYVIKLQTDKEIAVKRFAIK